MLNAFFIGTAISAIGAFIAAAALTGLATYLLRRRAILDVPNERSSHTAPTPRGGGWGVMLALLPLWGWATWRSGRLFAPHEALLLAGAVALIAVSWIDDRRGLGPALRFGAQAIAAGAVVATLPLDLSLSQGFLPAPLDRLAALLFWLWFINLFNFMDGIDGLAGGSAAAMGLGLMLASLSWGPDQLEAFRGAMIAATALGFLLWNWSPAKVFMGDVGSVPLGFLIGYGLLRLAMDGGPLFALVIPLYYLADATITLLRRLLRSEKIWQAHRQHFYQRSVQRGRSHAATAGVAIGVEFALALLASLSRGLGAVVLIPAILLVALLLLWMARPWRADR